MRYAEEIRGKKNNPSTETELSVLQLYPPHCFL